MSEHQTFFTTAQAASVLQVKPHTLRVWRHQGRGPRYHRLGDTSKARVLYALGDLWAWLKEREFSSTSDENAQSKATPMRSHR